MRKFISGFVLTVALSAVAAPGYAQPWEGPFGLEMGLSKEKVEEAVALTPLDPTNLDSEYIAKTAPTPNALFDLYRYKITPKHGLCQVSGIGGEQPNQISKRQYNLMVSVLTDKYGAPSDASSDSTTWIAGSRFGDLDRVIAIRSQRAGGKEALLLGYWFKNYGACSGARDPVDASGL